LLAIQQATALSTSEIVKQALGSESQLRFLQALEADYVDVFQIHPKHLPLIQRLIQKFADLPMDLADASLVILSEEPGHGRILSTDQRDFKTYRWKNHKPFQILHLPE
jgi:predicted nucleic acid-binding protein